MAQVHNAMRGVLSSSDIVAMRARGSIAIEPFHCDQLQSSSYDVTLGEHYFALATDAPEKMCPWNPNIAQTMWGSARQATLVCDENVARTMGCRAGDRVIVVPPGETILAHTNEFIGALSGATTMIKARSGMGRTCITVCKCAGWGDIGYVNRWTLEIENCGPRDAVLIVGQRIAQIVFIACGPTNAPYAKGGGAYQADKSLAHLIAEWTPEAMLPRTTRRPDRSATPIEILAQLLSEHDEQGDTLEPARQKPIAQML